MTPRESWERGSKFDRLSIDDGTEDLSVLDRFLAWTVDIVFILPDLDGEHETLLECLNELLFMLFLDDVLNLNVQCSTCLEFDSDSLSIFE